jgi:hypothetical protein
LSILSTHWIKERRLCAFKRLHFGKATMTMQSQDGLELVAELPQSRKNATAWVAWVHAPPQGAELARFQPFWSINGEGACNSCTDMEIHKSRPRNRPAAGVAHNKQAAEVEAERHTPLAV